MLKEFRKRVNQVCLVYFPYLLTSYN